MTNGKKRAKTKIAYLDGIRLKNALLSSLTLIEKNQGYLNKINVFPIPDRDTGTNLLITLKQTLRAIRSLPGDNLDELSAILGSTALDNAQGYSGTIMAHFFNGFSEGIRGKKRLSPGDFAESAGAAQKTAEASISDPVDGTLISVIRDWHHCVDQLGTVTDDFVQLWTKALTAARESLARTRYQLKVLKKAGVVDAGAQGFVFFLEGIDRFLRQGKPGSEAAFRETGGDLLAERKEIVSVSAESMLQKEKIGIVTDSSCDLPDRFLEEHRIHFIPLKIIFGEKTYLDKIDISPTQFYQKLLRSREQPKTSQPSYSEVKKIYDRLTPVYEHILSIHLPRVVSGTLDVIEKAARRYDRKITCIDGKNISAALGLVVMEAARAIREISSVEEVIHHIQKSIENIRLFIILPTVKYLVRGGRISRPKGFLGRILRLNPIISLDRNGRLYPVAKAFGNRNALKKSLKLIAAETKTFKVFKFIVAHADAMDKAKWIAAQLSDQFGVRDEIQIVDAAPVLGVHAGPGTVGFGFIGFERG